MLLPKMPKALRRTRREIVPLRGVNYSDSFTDGDLAQCENLSTRRWPYLSARRGRERQEGLEAVTALTAWEALVSVRGETLWYGDRAVGAVEPGEKQFAVVNTKLVIWPDKKYLDLQSLTVKPLSASAAGTGAAFTVSSVRLAGGPDLTGLFAAGDTVTISGCAAIPANNKDIRVTAVSRDTLTVAANGFAAGTETGAVRVERRVPDMDFICESENRLFGCCNATRTIYASALGDPGNFFTYEGLSTDSYAVAVGSEGDFTGCCKLGGGVLFWKERTLHKLLGSYPAEYALYTFSVEGLQRGCHKSLQVVNETLYYQGTGGVYAFSGGTPRLVSPGFTGKRFTGGVAGTDGERYYLSVLEGDAPHLFTLDLLRGVWLREDATRCVDFARVGDALYFLTGAGQVWLADGGREDGDIRWMARTTPFYENAQERKYWSRLALRLELPAGSYLRAEIRCSGGKWELCGQRTGRTEDAVSLTLPIRRCDKFELRLTGKGPCTVLAVLREFSAGSEV